MTAPSATARTTPALIDLKEGRRTTYTFAADPDVSLWEVEVTPFGADGGEPIDITTQHNVAYVTKAPQSLVELTDGTMRCGFAGEVLSQILALVNVETTITCTHPDGSTDSAYGYLRSFKPSSYQKGKYPDAEVVIVITNYDNTAHVEAGPVTVAVAGT
jgi:hypothetical protein